MYMELITRKSDLREILGHLPNYNPSGGKDLFVNYIVDHILNYKIKFPLLEFVGEELFNKIPEANHIEFCDLLFSKQTMGGLVIIGKILQLRLGTSPEEAIDKATEYISQADEWYICDIIGERVYGFGMCYHTETCFQPTIAIFKHNNRWVLRGMGAGCHFAIKRGLSQMDTEKLFKALLTFGKSKDKEIRQGIGWACKTTAKFHPELIQTYKETIENESLVDNWVRRKIQMGLDRAKYIEQNKGE